MFRVGVDLGGTNIAVGLVDENYQIVARHSVPTNAGRPVEQLVADIAGAIKTVLQIAGKDISSCAMIGVGAPGTCDIPNGVVIRSYSLSWKDVPLSEMLQKYFQIPVHIDNDANCAALAEVKAGAARGCQNMVLVTLGTGIGSGIVLDGKIYSGLSGSGTEIGHMLIDHNGELCFCGRRGCWDAYASVTALIIQAKRAAAGRPESILNTIPQINGKSIFEAADKGDITAKAVVAQYCSYIALGISDIVNIFAPEMILLGGGVSAQGDKILDPVRKYIRENCFDKREEAMPRLGIASMGNDAGIVGAAALS